jgi:hypothetical protein
LQLSLLFLAEVHVIDRVVNHQQKLERGTIWFMFRLNNVLMETECLVFQVMKACELLLEDRVWPEDAMWNCSAPSSLLLPLSDDYGTFFPSLPRGFLRSSEIPF